MVLLLGIAASDTSRKSEVTASASGGAHVGDAACRLEAHAIARAIPRWLSQSRVAMTRRPLSRVLVVVHSDSAAVRSPCRSCLRSAARLRLVRRLTGCLGTGPGICPDGTADCS